MAAGSPARVLWMMPPASYLDFLDLIQHAVMVITDSGGVQEETTFLGVPCLTYRDNTERPVTVSMGTNRVVGCDPQHLLLQRAGSARERPPTTKTDLPLRGPRCGMGGRPRGSCVFSKRLWQRDLACAEERVPL